MGLRGLLVWVLVLGLAAGEEIPRFPKMKRLLSRLDEGAGGGSTPSPDHPASTPSTVLRLRHHHWPGSPHPPPPSDPHPQPPPSNSWDDEYEEYEDEDDDAFETQADIQRKPFSSLLSKSSDWKTAAAWRKYDKSWKSYRPSYNKLTHSNSITDRHDKIHPTSHHHSRKESTPTLMNEVIKSVRLSEQTACKAPQSKVIRVSDHYQSSSKLYMPSCIRLHQCSDDTGCCPSTQKCGPKTTHKVILHFTVRHIVPPKGHDHKLYVEALEFHNHTECTCEDKIDEMPRDVNPLKHLQNNKRGCQCPREYSVRILSNGSCTCDCFDKQRDCMRFKKGKEYFKHQDRLCIERGVCAMPACDFGEYIKKLARCPRRHEKVSLKHYN